MCNIRKGQSLQSDDFVKGYIPVIAGGMSPAGFHNQANRTGKTITISASGASAGYVAFWEMPIFASDCSTISECPDYDIGFIYQVLKFRQSDIYKLQTGGAQPHIHPRDVAPMEIPFPNISVQRKIAVALESVDERINTLSLLIAKQQAVKKSTLSLLMRPNRHWGSIALGAFESHRNNTCSRAFMTSDKGTVKNIHYGDVLIKFPEIVSLKTCDVDRLTEEGIRHAPDDYLQDGDIVIADTAEDETVGKMIEIQDVGTDKIVSGLHTVFLRPPKNLFVRGWLGYWMNSTYYHDQLLPLMTGIKVLSVSKAALALSEVFYPSMDEQKRIVKCLTALDNAIADIRAAIVKAQHLKQGLMRYFFG